LNGINNGDFWDVLPREYSDKDEEDRSFQENLTNEKFVQNMSNEVRGDEQQLELQDTN